jgi:hypothetical protein
VAERWLFHGQYPSFQQTGALALPAIKVVSGLLLDVVSVVHEAKVVRLSLADTTVTLDVATNGTRKALEHTPVRQCAVTAPTRAQTRIGTARPATGLGGSGPAASKLCDSVDKNMVFCVLIEADKPTT